jgi:hypothetical protein
MTCFAAMPDLGRAVDTTLAIAGRPVSHVGRSVLDT